MVPRIILPVEELNLVRGKVIIDNIKGIAKKKEKVVFNQVSIGSRAFVIGISDTKEYGNNYPEWRFKTYLNGFSAMYYERWIPFEKNLYFLDRIYFHLFKMNVEKVIEEEYILLHCDASEPDDTVHSNYKKSPHLHIKCAEKPIPHSHFALNIDNLDDVLSSVNKVNNAMKSAVKMIDEQVLFPQI